MTMHAHAHAHVYVYVYVYVYDYVYMANDYVCVYIRHATILWGVSIQYNRVDFSTILHHDY